MLVFGLVTGGFWLWIGLADPRRHAAVLGPRGAARLRPHPVRVDRAGHDRRHRPRRPARRFPRGPSPRPPGTPPAGVHMPAPSFRPLLVAMSMTLLVAGLVVGGWALILGFIALVVTLARVAPRRAPRVRPRRARRPDRPPRQRAAPAVAHGDVRGPRAAARGRPPADVRAAPQLRRRRRRAAPRRPAAARRAAARPAVGGCEPARRRRRRSPPRTPRSSQTSVDAPAGKPFTIAFDNQDDGQPHNVAIHDASGGEGVRGRDRHRARRSSSTTCPPSRPAPTPSRARSTRT